MIGSIILVRGRKRVAAGVRSIVGVSLASDGCTGLDCVVVRPGTCSEGLGVSSSWKGPKIWISKRKKLRRDDMRTIL